MSAAMWKFTDHARGVFLDIALDKEKYEALLQEHGRRAAQQMLIDEAAAAVIAYLRERPTIRPPGYKDYWSMIDEARTVHGWGREGQITWTRAALVPDNAYDLQWKRIRDAVRRPLKPRASVCAACGEPLNAQRSTAKFCSTRCRVSNARRTHP